MNVNPDEVRSCLLKICSWYKMLSAHQHVRLLSHVVELTLAGREDELNQMDMADALWGKASERNADTLRSTASQMRRKMEEYYKEDGKDDPIRISLAIPEKNDGSKRGYAATFIRQKGAPSLTAPQRSPSLTMTRERRVVVEMADSDNVTVRVVRVAATETTSARMSIEIVERCDYEQVPPDQKAFDEVREALKDGGVQISDQDLLQPMAALVIGATSDGTQMYAYVASVTWKIFVLRVKCAANRESIVITDYGDVVAFGKGQPTDEVTRSMDERFGVLELLPPVLTR